MEKRAVYPYSKGHKSVRGKYYTYGNGKITKLKIYYKWEYKSIRFQW